MRDIDTRPYSIDEERVAKWYMSHGVGGGNDPIGALIASHEFLSLRCQILMASNAELVEALEALVAEWEIWARYGSPIAKASNERVNAARAAIAKAKGEG